MCGRFTLRTPMGVLTEHFRIETAVQLPLRFNVAPTQQVASVRLDAGRRTLVQFRWGLIPWWAEEKSIGNRMINARGETVADKPAFRDAFKKRRCLVLADGYIEWKKVGKVKQPYWFRLIDERPIAFAGLWEIWRREEEPLESCTIITTDANEFAGEVHDRMPVILPEDQYDLWLDPDFEKREPLLELLKPYPADEMKVDRVSTRVNNANNDDPNCLEIQQDLFS